MCEMQVVWSSSISHLHRCDSTLGFGRCFKFLQKVLPKELPSGVYREPIVQVPLSVLARRFHSTLRHLDIQEAMLLLCSIIRDTMDVLLKISNRRPFGELH